jgi:membrane fusion protein, heavy metal efflux system
VTQRAAQLYAQSLRGGSKDKAEEARNAPEMQASAATLPWWTFGIGGTLLASGAFCAGTFLANRQNRRGLALSQAAEYKTHPHGGSAETVEMINQTNEE